jgi:hypothetical protein
MVTVGFDLVVVLICLFLMFYFVYNDNKKLKENADDLFEALETMDKSLQVVAVVLERLPEMVPQFHMNENPLAKLLEFFQQMRESQSSLTPPALRDDSGRFADGETKEEDTQ